MSTGRLTDQDRRRIAVGLVDGLGYAEIARRLDRPTSTISREIARNGGPSDYRVDRANRATWERARRPKTSRSVEQPVHEYVEQFATLLVSSGLPRMAARVLACLVTTDAGALTAAELVRRLRVSPASVSKAVGYLEGLDLVSRERDQGQRRERYLIDDNMWLRTWLTSAKTNAVLAETAQRGAEVFDPATRAGARLAEMARFFGQLSDDMSGGAITMEVLTVFAALVHAGAPRTPDELAAALGWTPERVVKALRDAELNPDITDPVVLRRTESGACTFTARLDRLTAAQRDALTSDQPKR
jgi:DNA-binding MarR family transcriptional regulator